MMRSCFLLGLATPSEGHFGMLQPPTWLSRSTADHGNDWRNSIGCGDTPLVWRIKDQKSEGCIDMWYTNYTFIPDRQPITLPHELKTYSFSSRHPWVAPGTAPIFSPCGIDGGNAWGCPAGNPNRGGCWHGGYAHGPDAREWYQHRFRPVSIWPVGSVQKIKWGVSANHGGGYSVRLCKLPKSGSLADLTEECFQANSLHFVGESTAVYDGKERTKFNATQVKLSTGMWRRNPIPACARSNGGEDGHSCSASDTQFPPPVPGMYGFWGWASANAHPTAAALRKWKVIDHVRVPKLPEGDYVLSFRFDAEQTPQVWNNCADVKIIHNQDGSFWNSSEQILV